MDRTRAQITQAAIELHGSIGPAATTMSAVAERAGVTRATLYRHFPNEQALFTACSAEWRRANPAPNPDQWRDISDPYDRLRTALPLLRIRRLRDRAIGGGALLMLPASAILMGSVLLTSIYLQEVVGASPLETGIGFLPFAAAVGAGAHLGSHLARHVGVRIPMAIAFALAGAGMLLLSRVDGAGGYASDVLPGLVVAAVGLGVAIVSVALAVMTGAREDDAGMLSGVNSTGHEAGGSLGIAALTTIATGAIGSGGAAGSEALASGLGDAFLAAAGIAGAGMLLALLLLPAASRFLPRMREAPAAVSIH